MENNIFPTPQEVLAFPASLTRAINDVRQRLQNQDLKFKPRYETSQYFQQLKALLKDDGWQVTKDIDGNWILEPFRG